MRLNPAALLEGAAMLGQLLDVLHVVGVCYQAKGVLLPLMIFGVSPRRIQTKRPHEKRRRRWLLLVNGGDTGSGFGEGIQLVVPSLKPPFKLPAAIASYEKNLQRSRPQDKQRFDLTGKARVAPLLPPPKKPFLLSAAVSIVAHTFGAVLTRWLQSWLESLLRWRSWSSSILPAQPTEPAAALTSATSNLTTTALTTIEAPFQDAVNLAGGIERATKHLSVALENMQLFEIPPVAYFLKGLLATATDSTNAVAMGIRSFSGYLGAWSSSTSSGRAAWKDSTASHLGVRTITSTAPVGLTIVSSLLRFLRLLSPAAERLARLMWPDSAGDCRSPVNIHHTAVVLSVFSDLVSLADEWTAVVQALAPVLILLSTPLFIDEEDPNDPEILCTTPFYLRAMAELTDKVVKNAAGELPHERARRHAARRLASSMGNSLTAARTSGTTLDSTGYLAPLSDSKLHGAERDNSY
ncbi:hypothetical protein CkaCkLH20_13030 [Colletotrichum karsti]|uniref:Uncharacterized protein n=1 Tax=Colletotrichum karsti TaxID=1095194 RepID=A0A9P6LEQ8_9PEZI|nr:uncharacterized protein CkaCkLH20_13030 [Colletotrichum karsti]KAF9869492.1 hypothetical protein CkaCkLH20_13030 [Colletotrichum karsti]